MRSAIFCAQNQLFSIGKIVRYSLLNSFTKLYSTVFIFTNSCIFWFPRFSMDVVILTILKFPYHGLSALSLYPRDPQLTDQVYILVFRAKMGRPGRFLSFTIVFVSANFVFQKYAVLFNWAFWLNFVYCFIFFFQWYNQLEP